MNRIWNILNSPLVVVIFALAAWPLFTAFSGAYALKHGINEIASSVSNEVVAPFKEMKNEQDEDLKKTVELAQHIEVINVAFAHSKWPKTVKVIGTINNHSGQNIGSINITSSFYRSGKLVDVKNDWLHQIKVVKSGNSENFSFDKDIADDEAKEDLTVEVKVSDFKILELQ